MAVPLFSEIPIAKWLNDRRDSMLDEIEKARPEGFVHGVDSALAEDTAARFRVDPALIENDLRTEPGSGPGAFRFALRIAGAADLLRCSSPEFRERLEGTVRDNQLIFEHAFPELDADAAKKWIGEQVAEVEKRLAVFAPALSAFNAGLQAVALTKVQERKAGIAKQTAFLRDLNTKDPNEPRFG